MHTKKFLEEAFSCNVAIMRDIDVLIKSDGLTMDSNSKTSFDLTKARHQHHKVSDALKSRGVYVVVLPSDNLADSVFIEDTAVCIDKTILFTIPGAPSRRPETLRVQEYLEQTMSTTRLFVSMKDGCLDGGDVLFTGSEIFVGISSRSNSTGILSLRKAFPQYPVTEIDIEQLQHDVPLKDRVLHLKSFCSMGGDKRFLVGGVVGEKFHTWLRDRGQDISTDKDVICSESEVVRPKYEIIQLPDAAAANCLYVNNTLIRRSSAEFPLSGRIFETILSDTKQIEVEGSELAKIDGALTCCSLLIKV